MRPLVRSCRPVVAPGCDSPPEPNGPNRRNSGGRSDARSPAAAPCSRHPARYYARSVRGHDHDQADEHGAGSRAAQPASEASAPLTLRRVTPTPAILLLATRRTRGASQPRFAQPVNARCRWGRVSPPPQPYQADRERRAPRSVRRPGPSAPPNALPGDVERAHHASCEPVWSESPCRKSLSFSQESLTTSPVGSFRKMVPHLSIAVVSNGPTTAPAVRDSPSRGTPVRAGPVHLPHWTGASLQRRDGFPAEPERDSGPTSSRTARCMPSIRRRPLLQS